MYIVQASHDLTPAIILEVRTAVSDLDASVIAVTGLVSHIHVVFVLLDGVGTDDGTGQILDHAVAVFAVATLAGGAA